MPKSVYIYALCEPETGEVRYIGKAENPHRRFILHFTDTKPSHRVSWLQSLTRRGLKPELRVWDVVPERDWIFWERWYIKSARQAGYDLVNGTDGGEGGYTSPEAIEKSAAAHRGRKLSPEHRAKVSASLIGNKRSLGHRQSPAQLERKRQLMLGNKRTLGYRHTEASKIKMREANAARKTRLLCPT